MNIFVGNMAYSITEHDLRALFAPYGVVERVNIITDRETGRPRGFGFVEMPDDQAAQAAIAALQGKEVAVPAAQVAGAGGRLARRGKRWRSGAVLDAARPR